jgi:hypothetical protein
LIHQLATHCNTTTSSPAAETASTNRIASLRRESSCARSCPQLAPARTAMSAIERFFLISTLPSLAHRCALMSACTWRFPDINSLSPDGLGKSLIRSCPGEIALRRAPFHNSQLRDSDIAAESLIFPRGSAGTQTEDSFASISVACVISAATCGQLSESSRNPIQWMPATGSTGNCNPCPTQRKPDYCLPTSCSGSLQA